MPPIDRHNEPIILFVTLAIQPRAPHFANASFHDSFVVACADADGWSVGFYLIMPDHIHLFCRPAREPRIGIKSWTSYLKRRITIRLRDITAREDARPPDQTTGRPMEGERPREPHPEKWKWQPDCWDTQLRNSDHYQERWTYVRQNPVRKGLSLTADDWPWQGVLNSLQW
jgi:putative transposase